FAYVQRHFIHKLKPVAIGHSYHDLRDANQEDLRRFEKLATDDVTRWFGLKAACALQEKLNPEAIGRYQLELMRYLRERLQPLEPTFRTPHPARVAEEELSALLTFHFEPERLTVDNLLEHLWRAHKIWIQPDLISASPGHGARISCHYSLMKE